MGDLRGFVEPQLPTRDGRVRLEASSSGSTFYSEVYCERGGWQMRSGAGSMSLLGGNLFVAAGKQAWLAGPAA
jgi:hypothetical protein